MAAVNRYGMAEARGLSPVVILQHDSSKVPLGKPESHRKGFVYSLNTVVSIW